MGRMLLQTAWALNPGRAALIRRECRRFPPMFNPRWLLFVVTVGVVWGVVAACPGTAPCSAKACPDGCCADGECLSGHSRFTCGSGGGACVACSATELCAEGHCQQDPRLDPDSGQLLCACSVGCCLPDGGCPSGNLPEACGAVRTLCQTCEKGERCERGACTAAACTGCIDPTGQCLPGTTDIACGGDGGFCFGCLAGQRCVGGHCEDAPCNVSTCASGCCNVAQRCIAPPTNSECGVGAQPCVACDSTFRCTNGVCQ